MNTSMHQKHQFPPKKKTIDYPQVNQDRHFSNIIKKNRSVHPIRITLDARGPPLDPLGPSTGCRSLHGPGGGHLPEEAPEEPAAILSGDPHHGIYLDIYWNYLDIYVDIYIYSDFIPNLYTLIIQVGWSPCHHMSDASGDAKP